MKRLLAAGGLLVLLTSPGAAGQSVASAPSFSPARSYATGRAPASVAIGDLNGDGKLDLATANNAANGASVLLNRGDGSFQAKRDYRTGRAPYSVAIGDLNGDGKPDLATANYQSSTVSVLANRGDGSFQAKLDYPTGLDPLSVAIGDLNGDGMLDLAIANGDAHTVSVLQNDGPGAGRTVSVLLNRPGLCTVQRVGGQALSTAKRTIARANCRVGTIRRAHSRFKRGRVISQKPRFGAVLPGGSKVDLVVSRGLRPS